MHTSQVILQQSSSKTEANIRLHGYNVIRVKYSILYGLAVCVAAVQLCVNVHPLVCLL